MAEFSSSGLSALRSTQTAPEVRRFAASELEPLIEFLSVRILETHQRCCPVSRKTAETNGSFVCQQPPNPVDGSEISSEHAPQPWRVLVGIAGIPGSGKSTLAPRLEAGLNAVSRSQFCQCLLPVQAETKLQGNPRESHQENTPGCPAAVALVGMDGFHLTRAELDKFPDPKEAHRCRGAPWTFDLRAFWERLHALKMKPGPVVFPTFDHAVKDPDSHGCVVETSTRVVVVEGLYILGTEECPLPPNIFDVTIFIDTPKTVAADRVIKRHVASGISRNLEEAKRRWDENDSQNADYILRQLKFAQPDAIIQGDA
ncbi:hypothetical protein, conserved [Eimeria brunetti]|uniref:Phosphoribulokinase/uridine kinase domain-containing protein n=1 Tax=Eimeria brunetti TaxID=51314 RepID=U6LAS8_9EIME|nr:hypothetical protein, conserved [Eimeria brunetti]